MVLSNILLRLLKILVNDADIKNKDLAEEFKVHVSYIIKLKKELKDKNIVSHKKIVVPYKNKIELSLHNNIDFDYYGTMVYLTFGEGVIIDEIRPLYENILSNIPYVEDVKWGRGDINCFILLNTVNTDLMNDMIKELKRVPYTVIYQGSTVFL